MNIDDLQIGQSNVGTPPPNPNNIPNANPVQVPVINQQVPSQPVFQQTPTPTFSQAVNPVQNPNFSAGGIFGGENLDANKFQAQSIPVQQPNPVNVQIEEKKVDVEKINADQKLEKELGTIKIEAINPTGKKTKKTNGLFRGLTIFAILTIGILMLLTQLGVIGNITLKEFNLNILFPYLLIFGAFILLTYRNFIAKIFGFLFFLVVVGGLTSVLTYHSLKTQPTIDTPLVYDFAGVSDNKLSFDTLIGSYDLKGKNSSTMDLKYYGDRELFNSTGIENNQGFLTIKEDSNWNILQNFSSNIEADLPTNSKFEINITNLAGYKDLNLTNISRNKINLKGGRGDNIVRIGKNINSDSEITIDNLLGRVVLKLPETVGIDLYYKGLYTTMEMIDMEPVDKGHYQSKNYAISSQKIKVTVNMGFGKLKVDWVE